MIWFFLQRLELSSIWALMAAFNEALPMPEGLHRQQLDGAFVEGVNAVSWMANNSQKLTLADKNAPHCWTFFSTGAFGKKNKVPQVNISSFHVVLQVLHLSIPYYCEHKSVGTAGSFSALLW